MVKRSVSEEHMLALNLDIGEVAMRLMLSSNALSHLPVLESLRLIIIHRALVWKAIKASCAPIAKFLTLEQAPMSAPDVLILG